MDGGQSSGPAATGGSAPRRNGAPLTVGRSVVVEMVRVAALEVPGVLRVGRGSPLRRLAGSPVRVRLTDGRVSVRVWVIARPNHPLPPLAAQIRQTVAGAIERLLNLEAGEITVVIDGVGAS